MNITTNGTSLFNKIRHTIGNEAYENYRNNSPAIEHVKKRIDENRRGHLAVSDITDDRENRLSKRIAREGLPEHLALERINGVPDFQDVFIIRKLIHISQSVCRINIRNTYGGSGYGTGFLISPRVLITNHHVLPDADTAARSFAQFNYELDHGGNSIQDVAFNLRPDVFFITSSHEAGDDPYSGLDFTCVAVEPVGTQGKLLSDFGYVRLDGSLGKIIEGENCVVIQHPRGDYKKVVLKDIRMITLTDRFLIYESDTLQGSSGSVVIGLGTGEVVALHHSAIPRKDQDGNWLRKDGTPLGPADDEGDVDWIGNEGVRISRIVEAIGNIPVPEEMRPFADSILNGQAAAVIISPEPDQKTAGTARQETAQTPSKLNGAPAIAPAMLYFEALLSPEPALLADWETKAATLVKGLAERRPLFSGLSNNSGNHIEYLAVQSAQNPWELAASIESLPHVISCTPDLEMLTDAGIAEQQEAFRAGLESDALYTDGSAETNEDEFIKKWRNAKWFQEAIQNTPLYYRWWNWACINCPPLNSKERNKPEWKTIDGNLPNLRYVQLDTGYSAHSKVYEGFDLDKDRDFIDNDQDARDEVKDFRDRFLLKHPGHATRTASITVGHELASDPLNLDGNNGILKTGAGHAPARLIPYRIAKSVILIGRGAEMVDAASFAIRSGTDVMFMCMGSYPRLMFEEIAREAYERGVIWVCAAGNEVELVVAPAMYPGTIAVAAVNPADDPWKGSSNGAAVDIAAPGEDVYVPFVDKEGNEIMAYGNGTSYATPHVASAAMLWKARHYDEIKKKYLKPWQVVEAFRHCLRKTARKPANWPGRYYTLYGAGVLDIKRLLDCELPKADDLPYAYAGKKPASSKDLGIREAAHYIWNVLKRKLRPGATESMHEAALTGRGRNALEAFTKPASLTAEEAGMLTQEQAPDALLRSFFDQ